MIPLLPLAGMAFNVVHGLVQQNQARKGLNSLVKPQGYNTTPEQQQSYERAQKDAMSGYSAQERAAYLSNLASRNNAGYSRAMKFGGNGLAGAIQAGVNYGNSKALNDFAANDAQLRRSNVRYADSRGDVISGQRNRNTQLKNQEYNQAAQAYGGAIKAGKENVFNAVNLFSALNPMALGGIGGGGANRMALLQQECRMKYLKREWEMVQMQDTQNKLYLILGRFLQQQQELMQELIGPVVTHGESLIRITE